MRKFHDLAIVIEFSATCFPRFYNARLAKFQDRVISTVKAFSLQTPTDQTEFSSEIGSWLRQAAGVQIVADAMCINSSIDLHPGEERHVERAVNSRRAEFASGRFCARRLLTKLGYGEIAIPVGPRGEPQWPAGVSGSISHDSGSVIAIVSNSLGGAGLGVDLLSRDSRIESGGADFIAGETEISAVADYLENHSACPREQSLDPLLLVFSAKEAAIKALSPSLDRYLDFREIRIEPSPDGLLARFTRLDTCLRVSWKLFSEMIVTFACNHDAPGPRANPGK